MSDKASVKLSYPNGQGPTRVEEYEDCGRGEVPCRFAVGDKVRRSEYSTDRVETVENVEWVREVWHGIEPYWHVNTDCSGGSQAGYWPHAEDKAGAGWVSQVDEMFAKKIHAMNVGHRDSAAWRRAFNDTLHKAANAGKDTPQ